MKFLRGNGQRGISSIENSQLNIDFTLVYKAEALLIGEAKRGGRQGFVNTYVCTETNHTKSTVKGKP